MKIRSILRWTLPALTVCLSLLFISCPQTESGPGVTLSSITIASEPAKLGYAIGEELAPDGLEVIAAYTDGTTKAVTADCTFSESSWETSGSKTVTVRYTDVGVTKTALFTLMVNEPGVTLESITVTAPYKKGYANTLKTLDLTGMTITAVYEGKAEEDVTDTFDRRAVTGFMPGVEQEQTITVSYGGKKAAFTIRVGGKTYKEDINGQRILHTMWYEPEEDPRQVIGYQLQDGTPYFDHLVMLYGMRLRDRNCADLYPDKRCKRRGLHVCFGDNMWAYFDDWETHFKPLRDAGIKILLSIVPEDDGVCVGSLYQWPIVRNYGGYEYQWDEISGGRPYPYTESEAAKVIQQIAELFNQYNIDGIAYDEEYAGDMVVTIDGASRGLKPYGRLGGDNILRFAYELEQAVGRDLIQEMYEIRSGERLPETASFTSNGREVTVRRDDLIDWSYAVYYGTYQTASTHPNYPVSRYGPVCVALADVRNAPRPAIDPNSRSYIGNYIQRHLTAGNGVVMYYCLRSRNELNNGIPEWEIAPWPSDYYKSDVVNPEIYLSVISGILHNQPVVYRGQDYPRRFQFQ